jgi:hypothetical protein
MIEYLPLDVNEIIYSFSLFSIYHNKLFCLSKKITKYINKSYEIKKYILFNDRIGMLKEDNDMLSEKYRIDNKLYLKWKKYNLHKWYCKKIQDWEIGDIVDGLDYVGGWCPGIIIDKMIYDITPIFTVRFLGWSDKFIESIRCDKLAKLGTHTMNPYNIWGDLLAITLGYKNNSSWIYCREGNNWYMSKINNVIKSEKNLKVITNDGSIYDVSKENVDDTIRGVTNAGVFFSTRFESFLRRRTFNC